MRKLLCLLITIIMAFAAVTVYADSGLKAREQEGIWYCTFDSENESVIDLKSTGFLTCTTGETVERGTWYLAGNCLHIKLERKNDILFTYSGMDGYFFDMDNGYIISRESANAMTAPKALEVGDISAFDGDWHLIKVKMLNTAFSAEGYIAMMKMFGISQFKSPDDFMISIKHGAVKLFFSKEAKMCEKKDGVLLYEYDMTEAYEDYEDLQDARETGYNRLYLSEDGILVYDCDGMLMFYERR